MSVVGYAPAPATGRHGWHLGGLGLVAFAHGVSDFYSGMVPFVVFFVVTRDHISPVYQGALGFLWYLTSSIVQPAFGAYADRHGRWWFLPASVALTACAVSVLGVAPGLIAPAALIVIGGLGSAIMHPEAGKYSAMLSGERKAAGISIFQIGGQLGFSLGPAIVAFLLARFAGPGMLVLLVPGAIAVAALFATMRRLDRSAVRAHRASAPADGLTRPVDRLGVGLLVGATALRYLATASFMTYLPNLLVSRGASLAAAGRFVTLFLIVSAVGLLLGGYLADRFGARLTSIASLAFGAFSIFGFFIVPGIGGDVCLLGASVLLAVQNAPGVALVQAMLPRNLGMALGLMNGVAFGIGSAMVTVVGIGVARFGAAGALETIGVVPLAAALSFALARTPKLAR
ncbi:MAG: MFS transporter [Vulcanimicrobiaceae bacterium]